VGAAMSFTFQYKPEKTFGGLRAGCVVSSSLSTPSRETALDAGAPRELGKEVTQAGDYVLGSSKAAGREVAELARASRIITNFSSKASGP
jgi:hypothetical protein